MAKKQYGFLRKDEHGRWYLIPEDEVNDFDEYMELLGKLDWDADGEWEQIEEVVGDIEDDFGKYRLKTVPFDLRIEMSENR